MPHIEGVIVRYTDRVTAELKKQYAGDPMKQLYLFAGIAQRREAMVSALYDVGSIERRLAPLRSDESREVVAAVKATFGSIWAQETSHTRLIESLRILAGVQVPSVETVVGTLEGWVTGWAAQDGVNGLLARWLVGIGRVAGAAPEFTRDIDALPFDGFCAFSHELERTAERGYEQMLDLVDEIEKNGRIAPFGAAVPYDLAKTRVDERFHAAAFRHIEENWLSDDKQQFRRTNAGRCIGEIRDLAAMSFAISAVPDTLKKFVDPAAYSTRGSLGSKDEPWVSDGGLGELFRAYGHTVPTIVHGPVDSVLGGALR